MVISIARGRVRRTMATAATAATESHNMAAVLQIVG